MQGFDIGDRVLRDLSLFIVSVEDRGAVAGASIVALAIEHGRVVNLEEEFQQHPVAGFLRIEKDLDGFGMAFVTASRTPITASSFARPAARERP